MSVQETPDVVYGRLLESAHIGGYAAERVASEFKWLLTDDRWKLAGGGFTDIDKFLSAINLAKYRISMDDRKEIVKLLDAARATQRASAKALGVAVGTINADVQNRTKPGGKTNKDAVVAAADVQNRTEARPAWFAASPSEITKPAVASEIREERREQATQRLTEISGREVKPPVGLYDVIVIDPPWPMEKIERDERPNQVKLDEYPLMSEAELITLSIPAAAACHVWLWTTHKFLPVAFRLLSAWDLKYVCTFVWHKPGGFQPIGLPQYNCEFALYARKGSPKFIDTKQFPTCIEATRTKHSEKPEAFYQIVRRVTEGRRLDMFNRRPIEGFKGWGHEALD